MRRLVVAARLISWENYETGSIPVCRTMKCTLCNVGFTADDKRQKYCSKA